MMTQVRVSLVNSEQSPACSEILFHSAGNSLPLCQGQVKLCHTPRSKTPVPVAVDKWCMIEDKGPACHLLVWWRSRLHLPCSSPVATWVLVDCGQKQVDSGVCREARCVCSFLPPPCSLSTPPMGLSPKETERQEEEEEKQGWLDQQLLWHLERRTNRFEVFFCASSCHLLFRSGVTVWVCSKAK